MGTPNHHFHLTFSKGVYLGSSFQICFLPNITFKNYVYEPHAHHYTGLCFEWLFFYFEIGVEK